MFLRQKSLKLKFACSLFAYKIWVLILRKEHRLQASVNRVLIGKFAWNRVKLTGKCQKYLKKTLKFAVLMKCV
jgi:hypothetical protein